jgi:flagellar hook-basal body complex protein FliE
MNSINDITLNSHLQGLQEGASNSARQRVDGFADLIKDSIESVNRKQIEADQAAASLASGQNSNIHEVMIKMEEAEISLRLMVQMRNKVVEAYQEVMRMQV